MSPIQSIVVPVDFSEPSRAALARARGLAGPLDATLHLVHAAHFPTPSLGHEFAIPEPAWEAVRGAANKRVDEMADALEADGLRVTREVSDRNAAEAIERSVRTHSADLVVMGTHGHRGLQHFLLGSVAERVIRTAAVPVMAVPGAAEAADTPLRRILFATDFSPASLGARDFAVSLAGALDAALDIVHVVATPTQFFASYEVAPPAGLIDEIRNNARGRIEETAAWASERGVRAETRLVEGVASEAIVETAVKTEADAIVMGTRGSTGLRHVVLGSVAERTLRRAQCPVVAVRNAE